MKNRIAFFWTFGLALTISLLAGSPAQAQSSFNIESGQWYADYLLDTVISNNGYYFEAKSNDTVIVRVANESRYTHYIPDGYVSYENRSTFPYSYSTILAWTNEAVVTGKKDFSLSITNAGWYFITLQNPYPLWPLTHDYSISILRMPRAPLSMRDLDVGPIHNGQNLAGIIGSGVLGAGAADLDAATFAVSNPCTVQIRMGQKDTLMVPQIQLFDPAGHYVTNDYPPEYRAEITATLTNIGIYTVVMNEQFVGGGPYAVSMIKMGTPTLTGDLDIGPIISGESKQGTINVPGDLDAAFFTGSTGDYVTITMNELSTDDSDLNPVLELFGPAGNRLIKVTDDDFMESVQIANFAITTNGIYTIICKDAEDRYDQPPANPLRRCRYSLSVVATNSTPPPPPTNTIPIPTGITASDGTYVDRIAVSWDAIPGITNYNLWRRNLSGNITLDTQICTTNATTYEDLNVETNVTYYYRVRAISNGLFSAFSTEDAGYCQNIIVGQSIESGQYFSDFIATNAPKYYTFFAMPGEIIFVRLGSASGVFPDFALYNPNGLPANYVQFSANEYHMSVNQYGWHLFSCSIPAGYSNSMSFNASMLRMPNIPLSYADLDVGTLPPGQPQVGTINVSADLDAGFFAVTNPCSVQIRMGQKDVSLIPNIYLYDPNGMPVASDYPPEYRAEISATLTNPGIYTVVCADKFNGLGSYALTMAQIPGALGGTDADIGLILSGETKNGVISEPGDLDIATFQGATGDVISVAMTEIDIDLNPVMDLYDPSGRRLLHATDPYERSAAITNLALTNSGTYTLILKDAQDRYNVRYSLSFTATNIYASSPIPAPTNLAASDGIFTNGVMVIWDPVAGITNYNLWRRHLSGGVYINEQIASTVSNYYFDTAVITNVLYYYKVRSESNSSFSAFSAEDSGYSQKIIWPDGIAIESGQYLQNGDPAPNPASIYTFFAMPGELVIIRTGHAVGADPNVLVYYPSGYPSPFTKVNEYEYYVYITSYGWYTFTCAPAPTVVDVSILRIPNIPLSYADLDVGNLTVGESKIGTIAVISDLDAGFFAVTNTVTVQIRLGQKTVGMVPNLRLFDPQGNAITNDFPPEYRAEITATLTNRGIYTVVCADNFNGARVSPLSYALTMVQIPASEFGADPDDGPIVSGETKQGTINQPGDLDVFTFSVTTGDVASISMKQTDIDLNPVMDLYDPTGQRLMHVTDPFEREAVITNLALLTNGIYTIVCKDAQDRYNVRYTVSLVLSNIYAPPTPPIPAPTGLSASDGTYMNRITVSWNAVPGITNYNLWRRNVSGTIDLNICTTNATSYEDLNIETNVVYYYRVRAVSNGVYSAFSAEDSGYSQRLIVGQSIESGQYFSDSALSAINPGDESKSYTFFAMPGEVIIVRLGSTSGSYPDLAMYNPNSTPANAVQYVANEYHLAVTHYGWHWFSCSLPAGYSNLTFNVSMLRIPNMPLSYSDLDVGILQSGQPKVGTITVSSDLDAGFFTITNPCAVQMRMGQKDVRLVPNIRLYGPSGAPITSDFPPEYRAEISVTLTNLGIYTIVCADEYNGTGPYALTMVKIPGTIEGSDTDIGPIISGETKSGIISEPGDLDVATFNALTGDVINAAMSDIDIDLNPVMDLYDPAGNRIWHATDPYERSASITNLTLTNNGVYTLVLKDAQDRFNVRYSVVMEYLPGSPSLLLNKPLPPSNLTASDGAYADNILVSWIASISTNVSGYDIWRSTDNVTFTQLTTNRPSTTYQDYNVLPNTPYYYRVAARNIYAISDFSNTNSGYCGTLLPLPAMTLTASDGAYSNYVLVSWSASVSPGLTGYDVWRKSWTNDFVCISTNWYSQAFQDYGVTPNLIYTYRVQARNVYGVSANSPEDTGYCGTTNFLYARRALLVGIDHYSYGPGDLSACVNDANGVRDTMLLADPSNRWHSANLTTLTDALASKQAIRSNLYGMAAASGAGDVALYYHSSHGGQSAGSNPSNTFICTYNANYTDAELGTDLALFRPETTVIIVIDTCYSAGMFKLDGSPETEWLFVERVMEHYRQAKALQYKRLGLAAPRDLGANIAFMTACDYNELSWEDNNHGLYTGYLLKGCTLALTDTDQDKQYNFLELHDYAAQKAVQARSTQHAQSYNPTLLDATIARALPLNPAPIHFVNNDFDGDGASDFAAFNPSTGHWRIASFKRWMVLAYDDFVWGGPGFKPLDGDYDGDRASDLTVYNESTGEWRIGSFKRGAVIAPSVFFGGPARNPVCGDYDGDGISDGALYEQPNGFWYIIASSSGGPLVWGASYTGSGFIPISGDFDGDQINDLAMYSSSSGCWYIGSLVNGIIAWGKLWGSAGMIPLSGDYDNDGYSDLAVYQPSTGLWYIWSMYRSEVIVNGVQFGGPGFIPVAGDYNGDGYFEMGLYQPATGYWAFLTVNGSQSVSVEYPVGGPGYIPVLPQY